MTQDVAVPQKGRMEEESEEAVGEGGREEEEGEAVFGDKGATGVETRHASQPFRLQVILREPACFAPLEEKIITIIAIARLPRLIPSGIFAW